jgi:type II secretory ATPase GspE/PulE/Tfp pilus assembly ATPase PilB-like protein
MSLDLHMPPISGAEMRALMPAFDAVPYAEALRRACVALRGEAGLSVVLGDPLDLDTQDWLESRLEAPFRYRIAEKAEVTAYLAQQEEKFSALDGISLGVQETASDKDTQEISFESAAEADSSVVKLVTSTLYDALKAGASDVHLECTSAGLTVKYRIDGVLTTAQSVAGVEFAEQVISRIVRRAGDLAHQGDVGARHRRAPRAAGRPLQGAQGRARHRLPRLGDAERAGRGRGAADPRPPRAVRPAERAEPGFLGF